MKNATSQDMLLDAFTKGEATNETVMQFLAVNPPERLELGVRKRILWFLSTHGQLGNSAPIFELTSDPAIGLAKAKLRESIEASKAAGQTGPVQGSFTWVGPVLLAERPPAPIAA